MKIVLPLGFLIFCLTACSDHSEKLQQSNEMINEVLYYVSKIDTFNHDYSISESILIPKLYQHGMIDPDSVSFFTHISYDELFLCFSSYDSLKLRHDDSLFINLQFDSLKHFKLWEELKSSFNQNSGYYYQFNLLIFNSAVNTVELSYMLFANDTLFKQQILERKDSGWIEKKFNYILSLIE